MKIKNIFDIAGRAMAAQMVRLNTISSNLANAGATTGDPETVYKPLKPEFKTQYSENVKKNGISTVNVSKDGFVSKKLQSLNIHLDEKTIDQILTMILFHSFLQCYKNTILL